MPLSCLLFTACADPAVLPDAGGPGSGALAPSYLPTPTGPCPSLATGVLTFTARGKRRDVAIWISAAAATLDGPLVFVWHGTNGDPLVAPTNQLGGPVVQEILACGGIVAAPYHDPSAPYTWFLTAAQSPDDDLDVADEVLGCAIQEVGVDVRHIHSIGFSAGALHTTNMSWRRSGYLASVVTYSGGMDVGQPVDQDPSNKFAAMIFHGGATDGAGGLAFAQTSAAYRDALRAQGRFAFVCDHGLGHSPPPNNVGGPAAWLFFQAHPYGGATPSPWQNGLPAGVPSYCSL